MEGIVTIAIKLIVGAVCGIVVGVVTPKLTCALIAYKNKSRKIENQSEILNTVKAKFGIIVLEAILYSGVCYVMPPFSARTFLWAILACGLIAVAVICSIVDHYIRIIPNEMVLLMLALGVVYRIVSDGLPSLLRALLALAVIIALFGGIALLFMLRKGTPGIGAGDLKYAMALSIAVGWSNVFVFLGAMAVSMALYCVIGMASKRFLLNTYFPMCMHLSIGLAVALILPYIGPLTSFVGG